jgi:hypothetical protein
MSLALPEDAANSGGGGVLFVADPSPGIWQAQGGQEVVRRGGWPKLPHVVAACQAVGAGQVVVAAGECGSCGLELPTTYATKCLKGKM